MGKDSRIAWCDHTFNSWWGCTKVSPACDSCYAETQAHRFGHEVWGKDAPRRMLSGAHWRKPVEWDRAAAEAGRPALVFCASMADVFEANEQVVEARARLWALIEQTPHLIWQLLTKRPENVERMVPHQWWHNWPERVWLGTTVEDQQRANLRIPRLLRCPAPVRFLSMEPLLEPVVLADEWFAEVCQECDGTGSVPVGGSSLACTNCWRSGAFQPTGMIEGLRWVIIGGESGPGFRPLDLDAARALADRCDRMSVPVFFKQASGLRSGMPGPEDLERFKQFPEEAKR